MSGWVGRASTFAVLALILLGGVLSLRPASAAVMPMPIAMAPDELSLAGAGTVTTQGQVSVSSPVPVLAYYYIWFDPTSWNRAKIDYPLLGRYSSGDENVIRQHIRWAKGAGIQGFIVSWKSTPTLNARLETLIKIAQQEDFKLVMIYQGLDFNRNPLPVAKISSDLGDFITRYANSPVFDLFGKPLMLWSGTWKFSREDIVKVSQAYRDRLLLLATEKDVKGYQRVADLFDGDAYYWSSVNPETNAGYETKLNGMAQAVHAQHGLWIAPAAPGFDARLVGGTSVVDRKNGDTLVQQMNTAMQSSPDAIGIISWNEFSENTYIEPSQQFGDRYLQVLASIQKAQPPQIPDFDSSEPSSTDPSMGIGRILAIGGMVGLFASSVGALVWRHHRSRPTGSG